MIETQSVRVHTKESPVIALSWNILSNLPTIPIVKAHGQRDSAHHVPKSTPGCQYQ